MIVSGMSFPAAYHDTPEGVIVDYECPDCLNVVTVYGAAEKEPISCPICWAEFVPMEKEFLP